jgi:DNA polymerase I-like protein with 3'-5' exonuclease and polymerase domains
VSDWHRPAELPDLRGVGLIALDTETKDDRLNAGLGSGWPVRQGHVCGLSVAWRDESGVQARYFPLRHPDTQNFDPEQVYQWLRDHIAARVRFITQNGLYDWGWLRAEAGIAMPPGERLEEVGALASLIDENRLHYDLDSLCRWQGLDGKNDTLLYEGIAALGLHTNKRRKIRPQRYIWQLPARYVGPYAERDAVGTLRLFEILDPILDREGTRAAYRLECDLLPMVQVMQLRGIRIDSDAAERARDALFGRRDEIFVQISAKLECPVGMDEIRRSKWMASTFDKLGIQYEYTEKGNPSFAGGQKGWMGKSNHWLPQAITKAGRYHEAANKFLQGHILNHIVNGRIHGGVNPHRCEGHGTKSFRFSYSNPPLQQMPSRDLEITPLIRGVFLPEEGEVWAKPDASQQEFRLLVHYACLAKLPKAAEAAQNYCDNPDADFHRFTAEIAKIDRSEGKTINFAKIYGAGIELLAKQLSKSVEEAKQILEKYDRELPFAALLDALCKARVRQNEYLVLYDGARRHFTKFGPVDKKYGQCAPCEANEAYTHQADPEHPWYRKKLARIGDYTALNALIQGSAARHTKLWMRAVWREGIVPLLQMHDCLDCSVGSREQAELVARLGCEAVALKVPMRVDLKFGRSWADATHTWEELNGKGAPINGAHVEIAEIVRRSVPPASSAANGPGNGYDAPLVNTAGKINCPFHDDATPSCQLYDDGHYHCFGCGAHGWIEDDLDVGAEALASTANKRSDRQTLARALALWDDGKPIAGTLAARYLTETRKLDPAVLGGGIDAVLRFHADCPFGPQQRHPCLVALYRDTELGTPAGIIRVGLTPEGGKIARYTLGRWPGSRAIKLRAIANGDAALAIGEGIESVLGAIRCGAITGAAWAMGPKNGIAGFPILPGIKYLGILVDNDASAPAGARACATRWVAAGRTVVLLTPNEVKDFNDVVLP